MKRSANVNQACAGSAHERVEKLAGGSVCWLSSGLKLLRHTLFVFGPLWSPFPLLRPFLCQTAALHVKGSARLFLPSLSQRPVTVFLFIRVDLIHFHKLHRRGPIKSLENKLIVSKRICLQRRFLDQLGDELESYGNHKLSAHSHRDLKGGFFGQRNSVDKGATVDF